MFRRISRFIVVPTVLVFAAACGSGSSASTSSSPASAASTAGTTIAIKDFKFAPTPLNAKVGDSITVTNEDNTAHQLKANDSSFDTGSFSSGSKTIIVMTAGTFAYHCAIHDYMTGVIQVSAS
jgi:plastocyanin